MVLPTTSLNGRPRYVDAVIVAIVALLVLLSPAQPLSPGAYTLVNVCHLDVSMTISPGSSEDATRMRESSGPASLGLAAGACTLRQPIVCLTLTTPNLTLFVFTVADLTPPPLRC
jgi:hypothetical protein